MIHRVEDERRDMSLVDSFDLSDYETEDELNDLLNQVEHELSTLRSYQRGAKEKLNALLESKEDE